MEGFENLGIAAKRRVHVSQVSATESAMARTYRLALLAFGPTQETPLWDLPGGNEYRGTRNTA